MSSGQRNREGWGPAICSKCSNLVLGGVPASHWCYMFKTRTITDPETQPCFALTPTGQAQFRARRD